MWPPPASVTDCPSPCMLGKRYEFALGGDQMTGQSGKCANKWCRPLGRHWSVCVNVWRSFAFVSLTDHCALLFIFRRQHRGRMPCLVKEDLSKVRSIRPDCFVPGLSVHWLRFCQWAKLRSHLYLFWNPFAQGEAVPGPVRNLINFDYEKGKESAKGKCNLRERLAKGTHSDIKFRTDT